MFKRLQQLASRIDWRYLIVGIALLLLSGCGGHPEKPDDGGCWPCAVYVAMFDALDRSLDVLMRGDGGSYNGTCQIALMFLGLGLLFFIMFHVTKTILIPIQEPDLRKFMFPLFTVLFKAMVVAALISDASRYIHTISYFIVDPILLFFANVSELILDSDAMVRSMATGVDTVSEGLWTNTAARDAAIAAERGYENSRLLGTEVQDQYLRIVSRLYMGLKAGIGLGFAIWREAGFVAFIFGIFIMCTFWGLMLTVPMAFLDAFVRLGAMLVLSPFCFVAWVFPATKDKLGKLWGILLGAGMTVMFTCIYFALTIYVIQVSAEKNYPGIFVEAAQEYNPVMAQDVETMSVSIIGIFVLVLSMGKLGGHIPKIANSFGAQTVNSSWVKVFNGFKKLSIAAGKAALAIALASPALAKGAAKDAVDVAQSTVTDSK